MEKDLSIQDREELALKLLASLPRSRLAVLQQQITPLLQFDIVGCLPTEVALQVFSYLPYQTLLSCSLLNKRWQRLANDQTVWKKLCAAHGWAWRQPPSRSHAQAHNRPREWDDSDDEGIGDSDEDYDDGGGLEEAKAELAMMHAELVGLRSAGSGSSGGGSHASVLYTRARALARSRHSAPSIFNSIADFRRKPDYKLLHQTHVRLRNRFLTPSYRLSPLQTKGSLNNGGHTSTIYCLQLYTYPETGRQVLFTGSRDRTVREWNLTTRAVERVIGGVHASSVLSICASDGYLASAGSDRQVALWDLRTNKLVKVIADHEDSVLCVRFNEEYLVSCSKDRTVRVYEFPSLQPLFVLDEHRAAVNTVSLSGSYIFTGSGDRSIRLWDAKTGKLLRTFDNHHTRGIASIDFKPPIVVSGSSDKHIRLFDVTTLQGWSTSSEHPTASGSALGPNGRGLAPLPFPPASPTSADSAGPACPSCGQCSSSSARVGHFGIGAPEAVRRSTSLGTRHGSAGNGAAAFYQSDSALNMGVGGYDQGGFDEPGVGGGGNGALRTPMHSGLVRSVLLGEDFVISGSYDVSIKVWDRKSGALVADLTGGHTGRIFCIAADCTKIVSCGEDQTICIWDFGHGIDTSFLKLA
ncbi:hypothetical protein D9611_005053 [Ephemerocybe angulata]|uniref:F-box domain-containing protein n=1 Tax=Ephemerocybe angulata TaxID=980116 RepID=A0A8H5EWW5_9AGAR|nr:hypothetical protein D9611_005053 [Tulosesus angulatus]